MKIAINTLSIVPGKMGGTETFLVNLVNNLFRFDKKNKFLLLVSRNNKKIFVSTSGNVEYLKFNFDNNSRVERVFFEQFILPQALKKRKVDILVAPGNIGLACCPCKLLLIVHDLIYFVYPKSYSFAKRFYLQNLVRYSCKKADRIITVSQNTKNDIIKYFNINSDKIDVIYEGVDYDKFSRVTKEEAQGFIKNKYGIQDYVYSPTSLYLHKNNDFLIKSFAKLKKDKKISLKLVITGFDPQNKKKMLRNIISKCGMKDKIFFFEEVPSSHLPYFYRGAKITVYLSSYEGFGLPILEAMTSGCPVLSSDRSSLPEVVGEAGVLVDPFNIEEVSDKMYELLTDKNFREECIAKGLVRAKEFSWENTVKNMIKTYEKL